jgi:hypothetical protein
MIAYLAPVLGVLAGVASEADLSLLLYPADYRLANGAIAVLLLRRRGAITGPLGWAGPVTAG